MKNLIKQLLVIAVMMFVGVVTTSCNKQEELETLDQNEATIPQEPLSSMDIQASRRSMALTSVNWKEGGYDPLLETKYTVEYPRKIGASTYAFIVTTKEGNSYPMYLKLYSHSDGKVVYLELLRSGSQYEVQYRFPIIGGTYSFRVFVNDKGPWNRFYNSVHNRSYSLVVPSAVKVPALGDDYSSLNIGGLDYKGCTSWVCGKVNQMWGTNTFQNLLGNKPRDAKVWKDRLVAKGYTADKNPQPGDIMWWGDGTDGTSKEYGHVAFVHKVEGNNITYSDYNGIKNNPKTYREKTVNKNNVHATYIHVQEQR
jgi:ORF007